MHSAHPGSKVCSSQPAPTSFNFHFCAVNPVWWVVSMLVWCCSNPEDVGEIPEATAFPVLNPQVAPWMSSASLETESPKTEKVPADFGSFSIEVAGPLGLELDTAGDHGPMVLEIKSGAIRKFGERNPEQALRKFDRIHAIDASQGTAAIFRHIQRRGNKMQKLCLLRPRKFKASITKTDELGVLLDYNKHSLGLVVREVFNKGHVNEWNQANPQDSISEGDRLFELNGEGLSGQAMLEEIRVSSHLLFTVLKYPKL